MSETDKLIALGKKQKPKLQKCSAMWFPSQCMNATADRVSHFLSQQSIPSPGHQNF